MHGQPNHASDHAMFASIFLYDCAALLEASTDRANEQESLCLVCLGSFEEMVEAPSDMQVDGLQKPLAMATINFVVPFDDQFR